MVNLRNILNYKASSSSFIFHHQLNTSFHGINYFFSFDVFLVISKLKICRHNFIFFLVCWNQKKNVYRSEIQVIALRACSEGLHLSPHFASFFSLSLSLSFPFPILMIQNLPKKLSFFLFFSSFFLFYCDVYQDT